MNNDRPAGSASRRGERGLQEASAGKGEAGVPVGGDPAPGQLPAAERAAALAKQVILLRQQFVAIAAKLADTEEKMAVDHEEMAKRHPDHAGQYWRTAQKARARAERVREAVRHFTV